MSLLVAVLTATFFAVFGFPYSYYHHWFSWDRWGTAAGSTLYLLLAGAGGGLLGWSAAHVTSVAIADGAAARGVLYGALGALALRADFGGAHAKPASPDTGGSDAQGALSLLGAGMSWTTSLLDHRTGDHARCWYLSLDDDALLAQAWEVYAHILGGDVPPRTRRELQKRLASAMDMVRTEGDRAKHDEGRALVVQFCVSYSVGQHLAKPS
jgi:hypothetical protein